MHNLDARVEHCSGEGPRFILGSPKRVRETSHYMRLFNQFPIALLLTGTQTRLLYLRRFLIAGRAARRQPVK